MLVLACSGQSESRSSQSGSNGGKGGAPNTGGTAAGGTAGQPGDESNYPCAMERCPVIGDRVDPLPKPVCPAVEPQAEMSCEEEGLECSYGDSASSYCRSFFACEAGLWVVPERRAAACTPHPSDFCPATPSRGAACTVGEVDVFVPCEYEKGIVCYCLGNPIGVAGAQGEWECYGPPPNGACPEVLPNLGDGCSQTGLVCHYGIVSEGCYSPYADVYCYQGAWEASLPVCPL